MSLAGAGFVRWAELHVSLINKYSWVAEVPANPDVKKNKTNPPKP